MTEPTKEQVERVKDRVRTAIAEITGIEEARIRDDAHFFDDLGFDDLHDVESVMAVEDEFEIRISDDEDFKCVNDYVKYLKENHKHVFI